MEENNLKRQMVVTANSQFKGIQEVLTKELSKVAEKGLVEDAIFEAFKELLSGEKKPDLKPFNLEQAKAGKPVCTRDGRKARIICFDRNDLYPIVALIECKDGKEIIGAYSNEGQTKIYEIKGKDLMMLSIKHEGWVNIFRINGKILTSTHVFDTEEEAHGNAIDHRYISTVKIEWVDG